MGSFSVALSVVRPVRVLGSENGPCNLSLSMVVVMVKLLDMDHLIGRNWTNA